MGFFIYNKQTIIEMSILKSGIYRWYNVKSDKYYLGQAKDLKRRYNEFRAKTKTYGGKYINFARQKYDIEDWEYLILEYCDKSELDEKEK